MSVLCDLALAAGLTLSGACGSPAAEADPMPPDDPRAWQYRPPAPKEDPPPPPPAPPPVFPPVVIKKEVIREVPVSAPAPEPKNVEPPAPDRFELGVRASYQARTAGLAGWSDIAIPASLSSGAGQAVPRMNPMAARPMDPSGAGAGGLESDYLEKRLDSTGPVDNSRILTTDRVITGVVENGTNSQLDGTAGGTVVIQVSRDVFGYHGRNILIPKGSRLVCGYRSLEKFGSTRAPWRCGRILLAESRAEIFAMKANVFDSQGHLGVPGEVDNRFFERYGSAFILAGISAAVRGATAGFGSATSSTSATAAGSSSTYSDGGALAQGGTELSQRLGEITAATLEQTINLTPILKTFQGQRVHIRPDTDWYIAKLE